jgi:hypothetical protein
MVEPSAILASQPVISPSTARTGSIRTQRRPYSTRTVDSDCATHSR